MVKLVEGQRYLRRDGEPTGKLEVVSKKNVRRITKNTGVCKEDWPHLYDAFYDPLHAYFYNPEWKGMLASPNSFCSCGDPDCSAEQLGGDLVQMAH